MDFQSINSGRVKELLDSGELQVKRSKRRTKTVALSKNAGKWVLATPEHYDPYRHLQQIATLLSRLAQKHGHKPHSDDALLTKAQELNTIYFADGLEPRSVRWVSNQHARFASCSIETADIRISARLREVPEWVLAAVLIHELAHLRESGHTEHFYALVNRYERASDAEIFLQGFSYGQAVGLRSTGRAGEAADH